jgi:hypothetical protein
LSYLCSYYSSLSSEKWESAGDSVAVGFSSETIPTLRKKVLCHRFFDQR